MGPSKKNREDAMDLRRQDRAEQARRLEETQRRADEAQRRANEEKGGEE